MIDIENYYTEWYPENVLPDKVGIYQIRWSEDGLVWWAKFDGEWYEPYLSYSSAMNAHYKLCDVYNPMWRGITEDCYRELEKSVIEKLNDRFCEVFF